MAAHRQFKGKHATLIGNLTRNSYFRGN